MVWPLASLNYRGPQLRQSGNLGFHVVGLQVQVYAVFDGLSFGHSNEKQAWKSRDIAFNPGFIPGRFRLGFVPETP